MDTVLEKDANGNHITTGIIVKIVIKMGPDFEKKCTTKSIS